MVYTMNNYFQRKDNLL